MTYGTLDLREEKEMARALWDYGLHNCNSGQSLLSHVVLDCFVSSYVVSCQGLASRIVECALQEFSAVHVQMRCI